MELEILWVLNTESLQRTSEERESQRFNDKYCIIFTPKIIVIQNFIDEIKISQQSFTKLSSLKWQSFDDAGS